MWKPLLAAAFVLACVKGAEAAPSRDALVVNTGLACEPYERQGSGDPACRQRSGIQGRSHPGARLVDGKVLQVNTPEGLSVEVPPPELLHQQMEALGISDNSRVIVYNETDEFQRATRVLFTLDVAGFGDHSSLLDGGLAEWKKTGHAASTDAPQIAQGHLAPLADPASRGGRRFRAIACQGAGLRSDRCARRGVLWRPGRQDDGRWSHSRAPRACLTPASMIPTAS